MKKSAEHYISLPVEQLVVGLYVDLEVAWSQHPFLFRRFKIKTLDEIHIIQSLGFSVVKVIPERSSAEPKAAAPESRPEAATSETSSTMWAKKKHRIEQAEQFRNRRSELAERYKEAVKRVKTFTQDVNSAPANAIRDADEVIDSMIGGFQEEGTLVMNLINLSDANFSLYNHALNVTVLALSLGRAMHMQPEELRQLGLGALLHDIGKVDVPGHILHKRGKLTPSEEKILESHPLLGSRLAQRIKLLPKVTVAAIEQHHEMLDGTGFPGRLKDDDIGLAGRIVAIANLYDDLCNPSDFSKALSPKAALAILYARYRNRLDNTLVERFIYTMGVYPPGTIVQLNDDSVGLVVAIVPGALLKPTVLLYNPDIPSKDALLLDLQLYNDLSIEGILKPGEYPPRIYEYFGMKERLAYFYDRY
ncbi:MAG: hypothetical protein CME36_20455 [unclassified Hahellaceae]|nr:hypothetical protein [Hahellaceae bacterium]|tara:strand:+ start:187559 stop:188815 length:1257 start_codon:yes stop_codon:yes gene_type:complete